MQFAKPIPRYISSIPPKPQIIAIHLKNVQENCYLYYPNRKTIRKPQAIQSVVYKSKAKCARHRISIICIREYVTEHVFPHQIFQHVKMTKKIYLFPRIIQNKSLSFFHYPSIPFKIFTFLSIFPILFFNKHMSARKNSIFPTFFLHRCWNDVFMSCEKNTFFVT